MRDILIKYWCGNRVLRLHLSGDYPLLNYHEISEGNIKCEEWSRQLWYDMTKKSYWKKYMFYSGHWTKFTMNPEIVYVEFAKNLLKTDRLLLHNYWQWNRINKKPNYFTAVKQNVKLTRHFGSTYINFEE